MLEVGQIAVSYPTYGDESAKVHPTGLNGFNDLSWLGPFTTCEGLSSTTESNDPCEIDKLNVDATTFHLVQTAAHAAHAQNGPVVCRGGQREEDERSSNLKSAQGPGLEQKSCPARKT